MQQAYHAIEKLLQQHCLHPAVALPLFPLLTADPEEFSPVLKRNLDKTLPEAPAFVMDQVMYLYQVADALDHLLATDIGSLLKLETSVKKLAVKASLDLLKTDSRYAPLVKHSKELLERLFRQANLQEEIIDGTVDNQPMWNGKPSLDACDGVLALLGAVLAALWWAWRKGVFQQFGLE